MIVLFIGSNPSNASRVNVAFCKSTRSGQILSEWIKDLHPDAFIHYRNVTDTPTENNRPLKMNEIKAALELLFLDIQAVGPDRIVALGKTAAKALTLLGVAFYEMPHPSGLNRLLNDPNYVQEKVKGLVSYCQPSLDTDSPKSD